MGCSESANGKNWGNKRYTRGAMCRMQRSRGESKLWWKGMGWNTRRYWRGIPRSSRSCRMCYRKKLKLNQEVNQLSRKISRRLCQLGWPIKRLAHFLTLLRAEKATVKIAEIYKQQRKRKAKLRLYADWQPEKLVEDSRFAISVNKWWTSLAKINGANQVFNLYKV